MFVGVIVPDIAHGFYARTFKAMQQVLERHGYQLLVMNTERELSNERAALKSLLAHRVDGLLIASSGGQTEAPSVPTVFFDTIVPGAGYASVARANREGMEALVGHLADVHKHQRIALLGAPPHATSGIERLDGFQSAMRARDLPVLPGYVAIGDKAWSPESGTEAMNELLRLDTPPEAIVAVSDTLALGAIQAARTAGLRVPDDIALVSFDDPLFGPFLEPQLTALRREEDTLGDVAASLLLEAMRNGADRRSIEVRVPVELTLRRSCGCRES